MKSFRQVFRRYFSHLSVRDGLQLTRLREKWPEFAGPYLSQHIEPVRFERGTLFCFARHPGLIQELSFIEAEIVARLQAGFPAMKVQRLKCTTAEPLKPDPAYFKLVEREQQRQEQLRLPRAREISAPAQRQIARAAACQQDEETRKRVERFFQSLEKRRQQLLHKGWRICRTCQGFMQPSDRQCPFCQKDQA